MRVAAGWTLVAAVVALAGCGAAERPRDRAAVGVTVEDASTAVGDPAAGARVSWIPAAATVRGVGRTAPRGRIDATSTLTGAPATAMLRVGGTTFATGVRWTGTYRGSGILLSRSAGGLRGTIGTDGQISDAVPDGRGGAYLGGQFSHAGGLRRAGVVRVDSEGRVVRRFRAPRMRFVNALARGGGRLYVGGVLTRGGGSARVGLVALDAKTGTRIRAFRVARPTRVSELELAGDTLYVGGAVRRPSPPSRPRPGDPHLPVQALDARTGAVRQDFDAPTDSGLRGEQVTALRSIGGRLWVATGDAIPEDEDDGILRVLDPSNGAVVAAPELTGTVTEIVPDGRRAIVVGALDRVGGGQDLVRTLDVRDGAPAPGPVVRARGPKEYATDAVIDGSRLLVAGDGRRVPGVQVTDDSDWYRYEDAFSGFVDRVRLQDGSRVTGAAPVPDGGVYALARLRRAVVAGGAFATANERRTDLVALDALTGRPSGGRVPRMTGAMDLTSAGGLVWVTDARRLIAFDPRTGAVRRRLRLPLRTPPPRYDDESKYLLGDAVRLTAAGGRIFVFSTDALSADDETPLVAYDAATGRRVPFRLPLPVVRDGVPQVALGAGGTLYVGGSFTRRRPSGRRADIALLKLDARTGALDAAFDPHVDGPVYAVVRRGSGGPLLIGGNFRVGSRRGQRLIAIDPDTGTRVPRTGALQARTDPTAPLAVTPDGVITPSRLNATAGRTFGDRRLPLGVRGAGRLVTSDGGGVVAADAAGLLGPDTDASYGVLARRPRR